MFREKGFHGAGMRDIAARMGVAVGKLYYWFRDKRELLAWCQRDCLDRLLALAREIDPLAVGPAGKLWLLCAGHVRVLNEDTPGSLAHLEVESLAGADRGPILRVRRAYEGAVRGLIEEGVAAGDFLPADPKTAAFVLLGALNWTVKWWRPGGDLGVDELASRFATQLVRGLLRAPAAFRAPPLDLLPVRRETTDDP